jgi:hypothetical protein
VFGLLLLLRCLQERISDLKVQLAALVDSFEQQCGTFCSAFSRQQLQQQQAELQQQEQQAEACLRAAQQQLQAKGKQLTEQNAAVKQLQQQVADSRAIIKGERVIWRAACCGIVLFVGWLLRVMLACRTGTNRLISLSGMPGHDVHHVAAYLYACHLSYLQHNHQLFDFDTFLAFLFPAELKQQVAAESSPSHELLLQLEHGTCPIFINSTANYFIVFPAELKQQVAAESSLSHELLLHLEHAEREGPPAQQLARLRAELAEREEEQLCQRCR